MQSHDKVRFYLKHEWKLYIELCVNVPYGSTHLDVVTLFSTEDNVEEEKLQTFP